MGGQYYTELERYPDGNVHVRFGGHKVQYCLNLRQSSSKLDHPLAETSDS